MVIGGLGLGIKVNWVATVAFSLSFSLSFFSLFFLLFSFKINYNCNFGLNANLLFIQSNETLNFDNSFSSLTFMPVVISYFDQTKFDA